MENKKEYLTCNTLAAMHPPRAKQNEQHIRNPALNIMPPTATYLLGVASCTLLQLSTGCEQASSANSKCHHLQHTSPVLPAAALASVDQLAAESHVSKHPAARKASPANFQGHSCCSNLLSSKAANVIMAESYMPGGGCRGKAVTRTSRWCRVGATPRSRLTSSSATAVSRKKPPHWLLMFLLAWLLLPHTHLCLSPKTCGCFWAKGSILQCCHCLNHHCTCHTSKLTPYCEAPPIHCCCCCCAACCWPG